ncbi:MAG: DUF3526 domain-containing protein, partial [Blastocatellia bacterium]
QIAPVVERYDNALAAQQSFVQRVSVFSPALLTQETLNDLAGTGFSRHRRFYDQMLEFYRAHLDFYEAKSFSDTRLTSSDYDQMPRFVFHEETNEKLAMRVGMRVLPLLILISALGFLIWRKSSTLTSRFF